jgi:hypothetical protein
MVIIINFHLSYKKNIEINLYDQKDEKDEKDVLKVISEVINTTLYFPRFFYNNAFHIRKWQ